MPLKPEHRMVEAELRPERPGRIEIRPLCPRANPPFVTGSTPNRLPDDTRFPRFKAAVKEKRPPGEDHGQRPGLTVGPATASGVQSRWGWRILLALLRIRMSVIAAFTIEAWLSEGSVGNDSPLILPLSPLEGDG